METETYNDANYSNVTAGKITRDLGQGLSVQRSTAQQGGELTMEIGVNSTSDITAHTINNLVIGRFAIGNITADTINNLEIGLDALGDITAGTIINSVIIEGDAIGNIVVQEHSGWLEVAGAVEQSATIEVLMNEGALLWFNSDASLFGADVDFAGELRLDTGVPEDAAAIIGGELMEGASIDLNGGDVVGALAVSGGGGTILNGGAVTGHGPIFGVFLGSDGNTFSGTATFASVSGRFHPFDGNIYTLDGGNLSGTIEITGDMDGVILLGEYQGLGGNLLEGGSIVVDGNVGGWLGVLGIPGFGGDSAGTIIVGGDVTGAVEVDGKLTGSVSVGGDVGGTVLVGEISGTGVPFGSVTVNNCSGTAVPWSRLAERSNSSIVRSQTTRQPYAGVARSLTTEAMP